MVDRSIRGRRHRRRVLPATLVVVALVAAACGDDDDDAGTAEATAEETAEETAEATTAPTEAPAEATTAPTEAPAEATTAPTEAPAEETAEESSTAEAPAEVEGKVTDFAAYVGGEGAADDSLPPIKIGYYNQQGGAVAVSTTNEIGIDTAVEYINTHAGGIGGHPLEVVKCFIANTEEEAQQCGNDFANDDEIVAIVAGPNFTGTESFYAALAGSKPVVAGVSVSPADTVAENAAILYGGAKYILGAVRHVRT